LNSEPIFNCDPIPLTVTVPDDPLAPGTDAAKPKMAKGALAEPPFWMVNVPCPLSPTPSARLLFNCDPIPVTVAVPDP